MHIIILNGVDTYEGNAQSFNGACLDGQLSVAQRLYNRIIQDDVSELFSSPCHRGYFPLVQWLYSLGGVNIYAHDDVAFRFARNLRDLPFAQW
jgi:hypothetical protein